MIRKSIDCDQAPPAIGAYSQGVWAGPFLFLSGLCGVDPKTGAIETSSGVGEETRLAMEIAEKLLASEGLSFDNVVNARIYITDMKEFQAMNEVYKSFFTPPYPARATVEVSKLAGNANVEIVLVAYSDNK